MAKPSKTSGQVSARPILQSWSKSAPGQERCVRPGRRRLGRVGAGAGQNRKLEPGRVPFHAGIFDGGGGAGQLHAEVLLVPQLLVEALDFGHGLAKPGQDAGHLLRVAPRRQFRLLQQPDAAGQMVQHFFAAGLEFHLAAAQLLQAGPFALQFLLGPFEFGQLDLFFADLCLQFFTGWRTVQFSGGRAARRGGVTALLGGLKIAVNEFPRFMMRRHKQETNAPRRFCKGRASRYFAPIPEF